MTGRQWSQAGEFAREDASVAGAREFVGTHLLSHGLDQVVDDVQLVVSELATNALVHAESPFAVTLSASRDAVRLEVLDGSEDRPVPTGVTGLDPGGRGLIIVDAVSRSWGVRLHRRGGKSVWAEFDL